MAGIGNFFIRLATALIPLKRVRKRVRRRMLDAERDRRIASLLPVVDSRYAAHEAECRAKLARGERLSVAFLVCDASMFSGESVFAKMGADPRFECTIAVAPRVTRGEAFLRETLAKTVGTLSSRYGGAVRPLYDPDTGKAAELDADIVFSTVIYEDQTLPQYTTERLSERSLVAILYYGYGGLFFNNEKKTPFLPNIVLSWRYFVSNEATRAMSVKRNPALADRIVASGYCKMDRLAALVERRGSAPAGARRRKVIICPHHTIDREADGALALSTFLVNGDLFLELPAMFPEIDFVFRPHPLLFARLATPKWWGERRTAEYRAKMESFPNVEFQQGGDYFASFAESDAMIHDCGSFLAEYFYTGMPQCFMLESMKTVEEQFLPFSRGLLGHVYRAFSRDEIVDFIRRVVVAGDDPMKAERDEFARKEVCVNHPHATDAVVESVMQRLDSRGGHDLNTTDKDRKP